MNSPGCPVAKNVHVNAGDMGLVPSGPGRPHMPHTAEQLCPHATTTEALSRIQRLQLPGLTSLEHMLHKRSHHNEKPEQYN